MRILRVSRTYPREGMPGAGLPAYYLSRYIEEPHLFVTKKFEGQALPAPPHVRLQEVDYPEPPAFTERPSYAGYLLNFFRKSYGSAVFLSRSRAAIAGFCPDIVHIHTPLPLAHGLWAKKAFGSKVVLTFHGTDLLRIESIAWLRTAIRRWVDLLCYVSESMQDNLMALFPGMRLKYTPSGVDLSAFKPGNRRKEPQILAVGNLRWQKGYSYLIDAFKELQGRHPSWRLSIVGDGEERVSLQRQIQRLGLDASVQLLGMRTRSEVAESMQSCSIFVLPSVSEGFPKVLLEALACGAPALVTDVGCCAKVVGSAGRVIPPRDSGALAKAMMELVANEQFRRQGSQEGPRVAANYSWSRTAQIVRSEYESLLSRRRRRLPEETCSAKASALRN